MKHRREIENMTPAERLMYADKLALQMFEPIPPKRVDLPPGIRRLSLSLLEFGKTDDTVTWRPSKRGNRRAA